jgi:hypothetical protein
VAAETSSTVESAVSKVLGARDVRLAAAAVRFVAQRLDPAMLTIGDCERAPRDASAIESMGATMKNLTAIAPLDSAGALVGEGASSAAVPAVVPGIVQEGEQMRILLPGDPGY